MRIFPLLACFAAGILNAATPASAGPRIKDIVSVENVRSNQLVGYGLVVGLAGTGDRMRNSPFTEESMQAMRDRIDLSIQPPQRRDDQRAALKAARIAQRRDLSLIHI